MIVYASEATEAAEAFVAKINEIILFPLIALMTAVALVVFLWGCFQFVAGAGNEEARNTGKKHILWGIIGLLVMLAAFSLLSIAARTFGIDPDNPDANIPASFESKAAPTANPTATLPDGTVPKPVDCKVFSVNGCSPSGIDDPYLALREEVNYTGGAALGMDNLMLIEGVKSGANLGLAEQAAAELYETGHITEETYNRVVTAMREDANSAPSSGPVAGNRICSQNSTCGAVFETMKSNGLISNAYDSRVGDPVVAIAPGTVEYAGSGEVLVRHDDGTYSMYKGVAAGSTLAGTKIGKGDFLGEAQRVDSFQNEYIGDTHAIVTLRVMKEDGAEIDVEAYMQNNEVKVVGE